MTVRVLSVVGTRPNFVKMAPLAQVMASDSSFEHVLVHTGQHYDFAMSSVFFDELELPTPDVHLGVGSGSHTLQTAKVLSGLEPILREQHPEVVLVPGDVNSTLAAALAAYQAGIPVGHVEAGLRSFDRTMPEEINRIVTDQLSDLLFIHSPEARDHLLAEGRPAEAIHSVGNTMIDTLVQLRPAFSGRRTADRFGLTANGYVLVTLHRPALVDGPELAATLSALAGLADQIPVLFPIHPRTRARIAELSAPSHPELQLVEPLGYMDFLGLLETSAGVLTDSGGIQEESTYLGVPCFTLRDNTERPVTITEGTNRLLGLNPARIAEIPELLSADGRRPSSPPAGWDGRAAGRIVDVIRGTFGA